MTANLIYGLMSKASEGQVLIRLYYDYDYEWSPAIVKVMEEDEEFSKEVEEMIDGIVCQ